ncbi:MAG: leucine-rich repeat protein [Oscillospiraceae bacterium]|nr:leucine-rich repeat protein [Oscillospiraceae bacterium]
MKKLFSILLILSMITVFPVAGLADYGDGLDDYLYSTGSNGVTLTKYFGEGETTLVLPTEVDGLPVTRIGEKCFEDHDEIESVVLPETLKVIGYRAFYGCSKLSDMNVPDSLEQTGGWAFAHTGFTSFEFPEGFDTLGYGTFYGSSNLETVVLPEGVDSIGENTFRGCSKLRSVTIPSADLEINIKGFEENSKVTILGVPGSYAEKYAKAIGIGFEEYHKTEDSEEHEEPMPLGWICPNCGKDNNGNFCPFCGTKKPPEEIICTECGEVYPPDTDYAFCPNCGNPLSQQSDASKPASSSSKISESKTVSDPVSESTQEPTPDTSNDGAIPEELVGDWQGVGKPKNGGPSIDLTIHVEEDGTGKYTFDQAGYHESFPFTISRDGKRFSVDVPATSQLGSVDGTWEVEDDVLKLDITSTFISGGSYSYNAECKRIVAENKGSSTAEGNQKGFEGEYSWLSYHLTVDSKEIVPGTELDKSPFSTIKDKMFAKIRLMGKDGEILTTDLQDDNKMGQFVLTDKDGKELSLYSVSMWGITFDADLGFSTRETQEGFDLIFLVGDNDRIEDLTLTVKGQ